MKVLVKTVEGFDIYFEALEEHIPLNELLPEETQESLEEIWSENYVFCAKVTAEKKGIEISSDYLGACIYGSYEEFYETKGDYFDDMVNTVINEAKKELPKLIEELSNTENEETEIKVYFETNGYSEHVATFKNESMYLKCLPQLETEAKENGFDKVTESVTEGY